MQKPKIALVCDWLTGMRGGERCLQAVCELYEDADIYTLVHLPGSVSSTIESHRIITSYIQKLPDYRRGFRKYLPIFGHAIKQFDFTGYDLVFSFSHCVAKGVTVPPGVPHICYCHTPVRYAWTMREIYLRSLPIHKRWAARLFLDRLRSWDIKTAAGVTHFLANSINVQKRIYSSYGRKAQVVYPPIDCSRFSLSSRDDGYYLIVSAMVPYKRLDIAVEAFNATGKKLIIVGSGPEHDRLNRLACGQIEFVPDASDKEVEQFMRNCRALIFPGEEDFGMVPLEVQACGKPVIAYSRGGALETVIPLDETDSTSQSKPTGMFFDVQTAYALQQTLNRFEELRTKISAADCRANAMKFDESLYKDKITETIDSVFSDSAYKPVFRSYG